MININLIKVIKEIKNEIDTIEKLKEKTIKQIEKKYDKQIIDLRTALDVNLKMNTTCLECEGKKTIRVYSGMYDDRGESQICGRCNGTGFEPDYY